MIAGGKIAGIMALSTAVSVEESSLRYAETLPKTRKDGAGFDRSKR